MSRARILADYVSSGDELADKAPIASPTFTGTVAIPNVANLETAVVANTAKVTNATHTGDVTGGTALTIATNAVDIAMLSATGTTDNTTFLRGDNTWEEISTGGYTDQLAIHGTTGTGDSTSDAGASYAGSKLFQTTGQPGEGSLTNATYFAAASGYTTFNITWDFGSGNSETITLYGMHPYNSSTGIDKWRFEASNDDSTWVILDTQDHQVDRLYSTYFQYFPIPWNTTAYRYFRWVVDAGTLSGSYLYYRSCSMHGNA